VTWQTRADRRKILTRTNIILKHFFLPMKLDLFQQMCLGLINKLNIINIIT